MNVGITYLPHHTCKVILNSVFDYVKSSYLYGQFLQNTWTIRMDKIHNKLYINTLKRTNYEYNLSTTNNKKRLGTSLKMNDINL